MQGGVLRMRSCLLKETPIRMPALLSHIAQTKASQFLYSSVYVAALLCQRKHVPTCAIEVTQRLTGWKTKVCVRSCVWVLAKNFFQRSSRRAYLFSGARPVFFGYVGVRLCLYSRTSPYCPCWEVNFYVQNGKAHLRF